MSDSKNNILNTVSETANDTRVILSLKDYVAANGITKFGNAVQATKENGYPYIRFEKEGSEDGYCIMFSKTTSDKSLVMIGEVVTLDMLRELSVVSYEHNGISQERLAYKTSVNMQDISAL